MLALYFRSKEAKSEHLVEVLAEILGRDTLVKTMKQYRLKTHISNLKRWKVVEHGGGCSL